MYSYIKITGIKIDHEVRNVFITFVKILMKIDGWMDRKIDKWTGK